jgi:hypothetical protein
MVWEARLYRHASCTLRHMPNMLHAHAHPYSHLQFWQGGNMHKKCRPLHGLNSQSCLIPRRWCELHTPTHLIHPVVLCGKPKKIEHIEFNHKNTSPKGIDQWEKRWVESGSNRLVSPILAEIFFKWVQAPSCRRPKTTQRALLCHLHSKIVCKYRHRHGVGLRNTFHIIHLIETSVLYILPDIWEDGKNQSELHHKSFQMTRQYLAIFGASAKNQQWCLNSPRGMQVSQIFS